ncbi:unnamed protein product [Merluccius merluccius]
MKIGLRTSGHLLMGVVRIYSRKTKYLLADCNDAMVKIKVSFRPGQTDLPVDGLEAAIKSITLIEDFTDFDTQLPQANKILGAVDNDCLNQSRTEEITLKEDFGNGFLNLVDFGDDSQCPGILDIRLMHHGDSFGDENIGYDLLDFMANLNGDTESMDFITEVPENEMPKTPLKNIQPIDDTTRLTIEAEHDVLSETTLLVNEDECFALQPVAVTPTTQRNRGKRKRRLLVDQTMEMSNNDIREQLDDSSDLFGPPEMAPPTAELMQWKENGGAHRLFGRFSSTVISSQLRQGNASMVSTDTVGMGDEPATPDRTMENAECPLNNTISSETTRVSFTFSNVIQSVSFSLLHVDFCVDIDNKLAFPFNLIQDESMLEYSDQPLPSEEDSMIVHPSGLANGSETQSAIHTQAMAVSQDEEDNRMTQRVLRLLHNLKVRNTQSADMFSLRVLCEGGARSHAAATFFCLLVLKKEQALDLHQSAPYGDITATPGPRFHLL